MADDSVIAARVRELFDYDPLTGVFIRKVRLAQRHHAGDRADFLVKKGRMAGYRRISFDSKRYLAHRVAWLYVYGYWPSKDIDHKNTNRGDNWIDNLRDVPNQTNRENMRKPRSDNSSGFLGVIPCLDKWRARIQVGGRGKHLGVFDTPEQAHEAYVQAKRKLHEGCTL